MSYKEGSSWNSEEYINFNDVNVFSDCTLTAYISCSEDLSKLKYVHWCIKEGLRHYPPVYSIFRDLPEDMELDGHAIPRGILIAL